MRFMVRCSTYPVIFAGFALTGVAVYDFERDDLPSDFVRNASEAEALLMDIQEASLAARGRRLSLLQSLPRFAAQRVITDGMLRQARQKEGPP